MEINGLLMLTALRVRFSTFPKNQDHGSRTKGPGGVILKRVGSVVL